jgi:hypothetical protein
MAAESHHRSSVRILHDTLFSGPLINTTDIIAASLIGQSHSTTLLSTSVTLRLESDGTAHLPRDVVSRNLLQGPKSLLLASKAMWL